MEGQLVIGGHFWEVANQPADQPDDFCGQGRSKAEFDPNDDCQTGKGIAAYSFEGVSKRPACPLRPKRWMRMR
jgi:hypothetical protein